MHHLGGHTSNTGEARLDLSRLVLSCHTHTQATHRAAPYGEYPVTLSPCPPAACLPTQDLPVGWPRSSFSIHSITIPTPSRPQTEFPSHRRVHRLTDRTSFARSDLVPTYC